MHQKIGLDKMIEYFKMKNSLSNTFLLALNLKVLLIINNFIELPVINYLKFKNDSVPRIIRNRGCQNLVEKNFLMIRKKLYDDLWMCVILN